MDYIVSYLYMYLHDCFLQTFKVRIKGNNDYNTKRAFEWVYLGRTLAFLFLIYIMYKVSVLDLFFDYFSHYRFVFDRHSQIICSRWQSFDVDFVCIKESHNDFTDVIYHFYLFYLFAER